MQLPDIPVGQWAEQLVDWVQTNLSGPLDVFADFVNFMIDFVELILLDINPWVLSAIIVVFSFARVGVGFGLFSLASVLMFEVMGLWTQTMSTLALVVSATAIALLVGIPLGIAMARSDWVERIVRPILDFMQTMPPFVYLIPAVIFFGLGKVPGVVATLVFAMPPAVRLTNLGIRQVSAEHVEAGLAFGCTKRQLLLKVQMPLAMPSIMQGINQSIMMALSMVVIASMIGAGGLGNTVLTGIQRLNVGLGFEGGLAVVLLAILLDRITQTFGHSGTERVGLLKRVAALWIVRPQVAPSRSKDGGDS